ncbi:MAG: hypothetical protein ACM3JG_01560 [Thiohalocapsa sp.]
MPESVHSDADIILAAYADRLVEAFKVFAENLSTGQPEAACVIRFKRGVEQIRKARDLALRAVTEAAFGAQGEAQKVAAAEQPADPLSAEDQALVDHALAGTTGHMPAAPSPRYRVR